MEGRTTEARVAASGTATSMIGPALPSSHPGFAAAGGEDGTVATEVVAEPGGAGLFSPLQEATTRDEARTAAIRAR
jgi:hypothetical protein